MKKLFFSSMDIITRFWILILVVVGGAFIIYDNVLENIEQKKNYC